jgi:hypothetical protein
MSKYEPCSICEEFIEGVICDKDKCPVGIMKKENERLQMLQKPTEASGYKIENGKVVFYTNILNGYRHEYANLDEVVQDLNLMLQNAYKNDEIISHYKGALQIAKSEAYREFALDLKCGVPQETGVIRCADVDNTLNELTRNLHGTVPPIWTDEHLEELLRDFLLIPKSQ